jgi:acyl carrier protein
VKGPKLQPADSESQCIQRKLIALFSKRLAVHVPSKATDLSKILDSQKFVELVLHIEEEFNVQIGIEDFEIENFGCVEKIAKLILRQQNNSNSLKGP